MQTTESTLAGERTHHTPGPWFVHPRYGNNGTFDIWTAPDATDGAMWIADAKPYGGAFPDIATGEANAHLIAAAPEQYENARWADSLFSGLYDNQSFRNALRAFNLRGSFEKWFEANRAAIAKAEHQETLSEQHDREENAIDASLRDNGNIIGD